MIMMEMLRQSSFLALQRLIKNINTYRLLENLTVVKANLASVSQQIMHKLVKKFSKMTHPSQMMRKFRIKTIRFQ